VGDRRGHARQTIAHRVRSYNEKNNRMADKNIGYSNFIGPNQSASFFMNRAPHNACSA
jgi:hypothetical protein